MYKSILFVCEANKCRSAMAELLLRRMLQERGLDHRIQVRSGGIAFYAWDGSLVSHDVIILLKGDGIIVPDEFRATDLKRHPELFAEADLIITMTETQLQKLADFPEAKGKEAYTLKQLAGESGDIADPERQENKGDYDGDPYAACKLDIERCLKKAIGRICPEAAS